MTMVIGDAVGGRRTRQITLGLESLAKLERGVGVGCSGAAGGVVRSC
jgi:hypothetical protein